MSGKNLPTGQCLLWLCRHLTDWKYNDGGDGIDYDGDVDDDGEVGDDWLWHWRPPEDVLAVLLDDRVGAAERGQERQTEMN